MRHGAWGPSGHFNSEVERTGRNCERVRLWNLLVDFNHMMENYIFQFSLISALILIIIVYRLDQGSSLGIYWKFTQAFRKPSETCSRRACPCGISEAGNMVFQGLQIPGSLRSILTLKCELTPEESEGNQIYRESTTQKLFLNMNLCMHVCMYVHIYTLYKSMHITFIE